MDFLDIRQSKKWSEYLAYYKWQSYTLKNGSILRLLPILFFKAGKLQRPPSLLAEDLYEIEALCRKEHVFSLTIFPDLQQDMELLKKFRYMKTHSIDTPSKTMVLNLKLDESVLWARLSKSCKYSINRANREGVVTKFIRNPSVQEIQEFHTIVSARGNRRGFFVQSLDDYIKKLEVFGDDMFISNVYEKNGDIVGTKMFLVHDNTISYIHGGTTSAGQMSKAGYKILWDSILHFKQLDYSFVDLEGLYDGRNHVQTKSWINYSNFKLKYGGDIITFPQAYIKYFNFLRR